LSKRSISKLSEEKLKKELKELIKKENLRFTNTRWEIYRILKMHHTHPTVLELYNMARKSIPGISYATVYNVLNFFVEKGIVKEFNLGKGKHFDGNITPHAHFICINCGKIEDVKEVLVNKACKNAEKEGWDVIEASFTIYGICPDCKKKLRGLPDIYGKEITN